MDTATESNFIIKAIKNYFNPQDTEGGNELLNKLQYLNNSLSGGNVCVDNNSVFLPATDQNIPTRDELLATESGNMMGGSNNVIKGVRNANYLDVVSEGGSETEDELMYGGRDKPSPGDEMHQQALDYLKDDLKLEPLEARAYKSLAYQEVKENNPDVTSLERSKLMLVLVKTDNFLDKFKDKLDERISLLKTKDEEREKRLSESEPVSESPPSESEKKVKKSSKKSKKSKDTQDGGFFSETSANLNFTENNLNAPYYKEYMAAKQQYLQAKMQSNNLSGGDIINFNSLSDLRNYLDKAE
jgi:hypothetical protein